MASEPVRSTSIVTAPKDYSIPPAQQIRILSLRANFDGSGSASAWLPAVQILDNNGNELVTAADPAVSVAAGGSASVSWFPGVKVASSASAGITQLWWFGNVWELDGDPQTIANNTWTQITFEAETGPAFGSGALVEFDFTTSTVRFNAFPGLGQMRFVRLHGVWDAGTGLKRLQLRFTLTGSGDITLGGSTAIAKYLPTNALTSDETYQELFTPVTPYIFTPGVDHIDMTAWAYQSTGGNLKLNVAELEVYGPEDANGQL